MIIAFIFFSSRLSYLYSGVSRSRYAISSSESCNSSASRFAFILSAFDILAIAKIFNGWENIQFMAICATVVLAGQTVPADRKTDGKRKGCKDCAEDLFGDSLDLSLFGE